MEQGGFDLIGLIISGGISTYPLVLGSVIALGVVIDRLWAMRGVERGIARTGQELVALLGRDDYPAALERAQRARGPAATVLGALVRALGKPREQAELDRLVDSRQLEVSEELRQRLWVLATIGTSAPFVGLFGTVVGVMKSFHFMAQSGSGGFAVVAAGISEALVATALGLAVAIVAVVFYNYFEARLERVEGALRVQTARLLEAAQPALAA
ncbi:MAG TPA: MotA/TolQ/ExbB proton channel family protein [Candidatus Bathyarchaeia archaeon]|nr:MotA/TolQ/ExbB proton channel family protein [Candidatus Bathyarchaeia archaeon]